MNNKNDSFIFTEEGLVKVKEELERRKGIERVKIADEIENARQQGDLSENAAYHAAVKAKEFNERRIEELEYITSRAVVKKSNSRNNKIDVGEEFILINKGNGSERKYRLVGNNEADPSKGFISVDSPIGRALKGKSFGDEIEVDLPNGKVGYEVKKGD